MRQGVRPAGKPRGLLPPLQRDVEERVLRRRLGCASRRAHSMFVSQCSYPIKGFHYVLEATALLKQSLPDAKLYTTGENVFRDSLRRNLGRNSYQLYIARLIERLGLRENVFFTGGLDAAGMKPAISPRTSSCRPPLSRTRPTPWARRCCSAVRWSPPAWAASQTCWSTAGRASSTRLRRRTC